jgi:MFS family permease
VYAVRVLKQSSEIGLYLTLYTLSSVVSNLLWIQLSRRYGSKSLILSGAALGMLNPALALLLPHHLYGVVFIVQGAYLAAIGVGTATYLLNLAPTDQRSSYIGLANTIVGLLAFSPVLGGLLADVPQIGYLGPMVLAVIGYGWSFYAGRRLKQLDKASLLKTKTEG